MNGNGYFIPFLWIKYSGSAKLADAWNHCPLWHTSQ